MQEIFFKFVILQSLYSEPKLNGHNILFPDKWAIIGKCEYKCEGLISSLHIIITDILLFELSLFISLFKAWVTELIPI